MLSNQKRSYITIHILTACQCNAFGTRDGLCQANGDQCPCKDNYVGAKCDQCKRGYYNFPQCVGKYNNRHLTKLFPDIFDIYKPYSPDAIPLCNAIFQFLKVNRNYVEQFVKEYLIKYSHWKSLRMPKRSTSPKRLEQIKSYLSVNKYIKRILYIWTRFGNATWYFTEP